MKVIMYINRYCNKRSQRFKQTYVIVKKLKQFWRFWDILSLEGLGETSEVVLEYESWALIPDAPELLVHLGTAADEGENNALKFSFM